MAAFTLKKIVKKTANDWQQWLPNKNLKIKVKYPNLNKVQKTLIKIFFKC